jgi:hypothetical protein
MCSGWTWDNRWSRSRFEQLEKEDEKSRPAMHRQPASRAP